MREHYYEHLMYDNPGVYDYELVSETSDVNQLIRDVLYSLEGNYEEINDSEEIHLIDWDWCWGGFFEENKIQYNDEGDLPFELMWNFIKSKLENTIKSDLPNEVKFKSLIEVLQIYAEILEQANLAYGKYVYKVNIFKDSSSFAKHFFRHLEDTADNKPLIRALRNRIVSINELINANKFPLDAYDEGVVGEWINIYKEIYED